MHGLHRSMVCLCDAIIHVHDGRLALAKWGACWPSEVGRVELRDMGEVGRVGVGNVVRRGGDGCHQ